MYEVEVKLRASHEAVRPRLRDRGERLRAVAQADTYYDAPHRDFATTDEALRVRRETPLSEDDAGGATTVRLTYKGPLVDDASKTRREIETGVEDGEAIDGILDCLGFTAAAVVEKEREVYAVGEYHVTLDRIADLGEFVEVEREADDVAAAREGAFELCRDLGLDPDEGIRTSYLGLLLDADRRGDSR